MALTTFDVDVENVAKLSTHPNSDDGYSPDSLKSVFDKGSVDIKDFINNVLIPELEDQIAAAARGIAADNIPASILTNYSITENKLSQEEGLEAVVTNAIRNYAITKEKLSQALQQSLDTMISNIQTLQNQMPNKTEDSSLAAVAKSGSYNDLSSKPAIPTIDASVVAGSTNGLQSRLVQDLVNAKANTNHASTGTGYGTGNASNYGHLKLSDAVNSTSGTNGGIAATPSAVKAAYDLAAGKQANAIARTVTFNSGATSRSISCSGVTASNHIMVSPAPASYAQWVDNRMRCSSQGSNTITVVADTAPTANVSINVLILP